MAYQIFLKERRKKTMVTINEIIAFAERAKMVVLIEFIVIILVDYTK